VITEVIMPNLYGYVLAPGSEWGEYPQADEQRQILEAFAASLSFPLAAVFEDSATAERLPFFKRKGARKLWRKLCRGDAVIVALGPLWYSSVLDAGRTLEACQARSIQFCVIEGGEVIIRSDGEVGALLTRVLIAAGEAQRAVASEAKSQGMKAARAKAKQDGRLDFNPARLGHGFKTVAGEDGTRRVIPNWAERRSMARVLRLRRQGLTWDEIASDLTATGIRSRKGKPLLRGQAHAMGRAALALEEAGGLIGEDDPLPPDRPPPPLVPEPDRSDSSALANWFVDAMREVLPRL
jgi:DNA invertase Pin-like site-specific DNA recombinase